MCTMNVEGEVFPRRFVFFIHSHATIKTPKEYEKKYLLGKVV